MSNDDAIRHDIYTTGLPSAQVVDAIANYCKRAKRSGKDWKCECPVCGHYSLSVTRGFKTSVLIRCWYCKACGLNDGWTEQRKLFIEAGLLPADAHSIAKLSPQEYQQYIEAKRAEAVRIWEHSVPITPDSVAAKYLRARGLESFIKHPALRCSRPNFPAVHSPGRLRPALVSRIWHVNRGLCGVQFTYLNWDGDGRARELEPGRRTYGTRKGGAIWIGAPKPDEEFVVGEGLETVLSAMLVLGIRANFARLESEGFPTLSQ